MPTTKEELPEIHKWMKKQINIISKHMDEIEGNIVNPYQEGSPFFGINKKKSLEILTKSLDELSTDPLSNYLKKVTDLYKTLKEDKLNDNVIETIMTRVEKYRQASIERYALKEYLQPALDLDTPEKIIKACKEVKTQIEENYPGLRITNDLKSLTNDPTKIQEILPSRATNIDKTFEEYRKLPQPPKIRLPFFKSPGVTHIEKKLTYTEEMLENKNRAYLLLTLYSRAQTLLQKLGVEEEKKSTPSTTATAVNPADNRQNQNTTTPPQKKKSQPNSNPRLGEELAVIQTTVELGGLSGTSMRLQPVSPNPQKSTTVAPAGEKQNTTAIPASVKDDRQNKQHANRPKEYDYYEQKTQENRNRITVGIFAFFAATTEILSCVSSNPLSKEQMEEAFRLRRVGGTGSTLIINGKHVSKETEAMYNQLGPFAETMITTAQGVGGLGGSDAALKFVNGVASVNKTISHPVELAVQWFKREAPR
jgi:hypothetical protein